MVAMTEITPADGYAGDISPQGAYQLLQMHDNAVLVDVRTQAEWTFVGIPDLSVIGRDLLTVEWVGFPGGRSNTDFVRHISAQLDDKDAPVVVLCRSGGRSAFAAKALTAQGFSQAINILEGFEGDLDDNGHRGVGGWKSAGLPWKQS